MNKTVRNGFCIGCFRKSLINQRVTFLVYKNTKLNFSYEILESYTGLGFEPYSYKNTKVQNEKRGVGILEDVLEKLQSCRKLQKDKNPELCTKMVNSLEALMGLDFSILYYTSFK